MTLSWFTPSLVILGSAVLLALLVWTTRGNRWRGSAGVILGVFIGIVATNLWLGARPAEIPLAKQEIVRKPATVMAKPVIVPKPVVMAKPVPAKPLVKNPENTAEKPRRQTAVGRLAESLFAPREPAVDKEVTKRFETLNFTLRLPDGPWIEMNPKTFGSDACYMGRQKKRNLFASIVIEPLGLAITSAALTEIVHSNLQATGKMLDWRILEPAQLAGISSPCAGYVVNINGQKLTYVNIHQFDHGYARQFVLGSSTGMPLEKLREEAIKYSGGFQLIDPARVGASGAPVLEARKFPEWGCAMKAGGSGWSTASKDEQVRGAIWHGNFRGTSHVLIVPVNLLGLKLDSQALTRGLLSGSTDRTLPASGVTGKPLELPGCEATEYEYRETLDHIGDYLRIVRVIRKGDAAWLVDGGTRAGMPERLVELRHLLDSFTVDEKSPATLPTIDEGFRSKFCNHAGLSYYVRARYADARPLFEEASRLKPDEVTYFDNILDSLIEEGNQTEVLKRMEAAPQSISKAPPAQQRLAGAYAALGRMSEARATYQDLFKGGFRNDDVLDQAVRFLLDNGAKTEALELITGYQKGGTSQRLDRLQAGVLSRNGNNSDAAVILEKLHRDAPGNINLLIELTDVYGTLDRHAEAVTLLREGLAAEPKSALLLYNLGYQLAASEKYDEAAEILEQAVLAAPKDETIQEELAYVHSRLGRGHDREIRTPLDPVPVPPSLEVPPDWNPSSVPKDADRYHLNDVTAYQFKPGTPITRTNHAEILVMTDRAVEALSTLEFRFTPLNERIYMNHLEVIGSDGKIIATGKDKDQYVTEAGGIEATAAKLLCVPVPGLAIGCRLRYSVTYRDRSPSDEFPFEVKYLVTRYGSRTSAVCVRGAVDSCASFTRGDVESHADGDFKIWSAKDLPALPNESRTAALEDFAPVIYLGPTGTDWTKLGDTYLDDIHKQLAADPDIESLARDLVAEAPDEEAKIRTLYRWIQNEFTYKAIEFGSRSRIPHPAGITCANRYGDCKDLSVLLHSLLRAVGIASEPCLVNTSDRVVTALPSLDQFNHMILHLPASGNRPDCWLDATDRQHALTLTVASWLEGRDTFILGTGSSRFGKVPDLPFPSPHVLRIDRQLEAGKDADLLVSETLTANGSTADGLRSYIASIPAAERLQQLREMITGIDPAFTLNTLNVKNLKDQDLPFVLELTLTAADHLAPGGVLKKLPVDWERDYLEPVAQRQRLTPFATSSAWTVESRTQGSVKLPESVKAAHAESPQWGTWNIEAANEGSWHIDFTASLKKGDLFPPSDYQGFFRFWDDGINRLTRPWESH
ncbi:MAG: DUF3857 domain-containing protein [Luteolibacter sp.]|uniref:DUF3857 domain-containing protein n=1 Tax=Luteolibacter sp. TaxID=1962973 RepID=UPI0032667177